MKQLLIFKMLVFFLVTSIFGQTTGTVEIGSGTLTNSTTVHPTPYGTYYKNHRVQYLYLASEMSAAGLVAGNITSIAFDVAALNTCSPMPNFKIDAKLTTASDLTTTFDNAGYTTVYTNTSFMPVAGWNTHIFSTPLAWDGTSNLLIDICFDLLTDYTQNASVNYTTTSSNLASYYRSDSAPACATTSSATVSTSRANIQISGNVASCLPPALSSLTVSNLSQTSADLGWSGPTNAIAWNVEVHTPGNSPGIGTPVASVTAHPTSTWTATGLSSVTNYDFYVQAHCGGTDYSIWQGPVQFQTTGAPLSGAYTINNTQPSGGTNFNSFTDFADAINLGGFAGPVTVDVAVGTGPYTEQVVLIQLPNSSSTNTLTINGNGETLQFLSTNTNERATLKFDGTDYVTVNNLIVKALGSITSPAEYGWAVWLTNDADYNTFSNCEFHAATASTSSNFSAFVTSSSSTGATTAGPAASYLTVTNSKTFGGYYGMVINGNTSSIPYSEGNIIQNNEISDFYMYGLYVRGQNNSQIIGNEIHRTNRAENSTAYMLYGAGNISNSEFSKNVIFNFTGTGQTTTSTAYGLYFTSVTSPVNEGILIANNVIYGLDNRNGSQYGMYFSSTTAEMNIYHNSVSLDHVAHTGSSVIYCLYHTGASTNLDIQNNIFSYTTNSTGTKYCMYFSTNTAVVTSNNNVLYAGATAGTNNTGYWSSTAYATLADWQTANGGAFDQNSLDAAPIFNTPLLTPTGGAIDNIGANLLTFVPDDIFGIARTATPDPGAIEFDPPACSMPYSLTATNISDVSADLGWTAGGTETEWNIEVHTPGNSPGNGTPVVSVTGTTSNPWTATGLTQYTDYVFFVQADCGTSISDWAGPFAFTTTLPPLSGFYTINSTQPTAGTNFNSFTDFATAIQLGGLGGFVTVDVVAGTGPYTEQVAFGQLNNSSATNLLTINGNGETLQFLSTNSSERAILKFDGTDYVVVNNLIVKALASTTSEYGWGVWLTNNADYIAFDNCEFHADLETTSSNHVPFVTSNSATGATTAGLAASHLTIINSKVIGGYYGMVINGPTSAPFSENNVIMNNEIRDFYYYGLYVRGQNYSEFIGNELHRTNRTNNSTLYTIYMTSNISNTVVSKNILYNLGGTAASTSSAYGIYATSMTSTVNEGILISNNIVNGFENRNGTQYGMYLSTTGYAQVYHNTVSMDNVNHTGSSTIYTFYHTGANANLDIQNNIFSYTTNSSGTKYCMYFSTNTAVVNSNNNVLHRGATAGTNNTGYWSSTAYNTLADWQTANTGIYDQNSVDADPIFTLPLLSPINAAVDNIGANLLSFVPDDIFGVARTPSPDPGAIEFTPVSADIALLSGELVRVSSCLNNNDSIYFTLRNVLGNVLDFAATPVTVFWSVNGPVNSTGSTTINTGTLAAGTDIKFGGNGVDMSVDGTYMLASAYIIPSTENNIQTNDTITDAFSIVVPAYEFDAQPDYTLVTNSVDVVELSVSSNVLPIQGSFFFTEIAHYKTTTGAPTSGWPSYLIADDYVEITGLPNGDISGFTLEIWTSSALESAQVLGSGTVLSPMGTCVIATGQLGSSVPSPADYYYHSGATASQSSTTAKGYILKDPNGNIIDAVVLGNLTFPAASGVTPADWSGTTPAVSSSGNRLEGPYTKDATYWINSGTSPQDPNVVNNAVTVPSPMPLTGFSWSLDGVVTSVNNTDTIVGPWTVNGIYNYVATYTNTCGTFTDTAVVEVFVPQSDLAIIDIIAPLEEVCYDTDEPVTIALSNLGTTAISTPFTASYTVNGGIPVTETVNLTVGPADTVTYTFTTPISIVLTEDTTFYLNAYVNLAGDPFNFNDTLGVTRTFYYVPPAPIGVNDTVTIGGSATLQALSPYNVSWYASPTDPTVIHTGNTFTTPALFATTPYYAAASAGTGTQYVGPVDNTIGTTSTSSLTNHFMIFDVLDPNGVTIQSVDVIPSTAAGSAYTIVIQNSSQTQIASYAGVTTVASGSIETVPVDFVIPQGTGYRMGFAVNPTMWRNEAGASYPYTIPNVISITGNTFNTSYYYYFYNWAIGSGSGCESERTEILAVVDAVSCTPVTSVNVSNITPVSADLSWIPGGTEETWEIELGLAGFTPTETATHTVSITPNTTISGLTQATDYEFYIRAYCDPDYSIWTGPYSFSTPCGVFSAPFVEDFEVIPPLCWSVFSTTTQNWGISSQASGYGIGSNSAVAQFYNYSDPAPFYLITPEFDASALTSPVVKFDFAYAAYSTTYIDELNILYSTDGGTTLNLLQNMQGGATGPLNTGGVVTSSFVPAATEWSTIEFALPTGTNLVVFEAVSDYGNNLFIDNVAIQEASVSCVNFEETTQEDICEGDIFSWRGNDYSISGTYYDSLVTTNPPGCDSVYVLILTVHALPTVEITGLGNFYCVYYDEVTMTGSPAGGTFTGNGVTGNVFDPAAAGIGTWDVVYTYSDANGCTNSDTVTVVVDECVSIGEHQNGDFAVYPNPVNDLLTVEIVATESSQHIWSIYDTNGKLIMSGTQALVSGKNTLTVETEHLSSGLYMLQSNVNGLIQSVRIIKQ